MKWVKVGNAGIRHFRYVAAPTLSATFFRVNDSALAFRPLGDRSARPRRKGSSTRSLLSSFAALLVVFAGCGSPRPAPSGSASSGGASGSVSSGGPLGFRDGGISTKPPGCGQKADGSFCDCVDVPLFAEPPNMYFVLDRSGSMAQEDKWSKVRVVVAQIFRSLGPRANFGVSVFPGLEANSCTPAREVVPLSPGDPPGSTDGPTTTKLLTTTSTAPEGGTPTAQALRAALDALRKAKGKSFVILATDGGPNCNAAAVCNVDQCMPNIDNVPGCSPSGASCCDPPNGARESCLDAGPTLSAVTALKNAGFPVYVIGLPGTAAYASLLDQVALSGGTALAGSPKYYAVASTADNTALLKALKQIAAKIVATCEFKLTSEPSQANLVNVYLDEVVLPKDQVNGWTINGATVTLVGQTCAKVLSGEVLDVRIITGCPTTEPR